MERRDCWVIKACGREPGGENVGELGVCPAALPNEYGGVNRGRHAGRFCWAVAGTLCGGEAQGTYAKKLLNCIDCEFLKRVNDDEGHEFVLTPQQIKRAS